MAVPVIVLAIGATFIGWLQVPGGWQLVDDWLEPALTAAPDIEVTTAAEVIASVASVALSLVAIALAWWVFVADPAGARGSQASRPRRATCWPTSTASTRSTSRPSCSPGATWATS